MKHLLLISALLLTTFPAISGPCKAITQKGTQCTRTAKENGYCLQHDPARPKCKGTTQTGKPCSLSPKAGSQFCHYHQPKN